jgi:hypothetical protein
MISICQGCDFLVLIRSEVGFDEGYDQLYYSKTKYYHYCYYYYDYHSKTLAGIMVITRQELLLTFR